MPIRNSIGAFKVDLNDFAKKMELDVATVRRKVALDIHRGVTEKTPVDTGRARASWNLSDGAPNLRNAPEGKQTGTGEIGAKSNNPFGRTFVANGLPYIRALEFGHSSQAPFGMVRVTLAEVAAGIQATSERFR